MSDITLASDAGLEGMSILYKKPISRRVGGNGILAGMPCYIDSNGLIQKSVSTVNSPSTGTFMRSSFDGVPASDLPSGSFGELYGIGAEARIADSGLTIGTQVWISNTAGKWADAKVATNDEPVAIVISATSIKLERGV